VKGRLGFFEEGAPIGYSQKFARNKRKLNFRLDGNNCMRFDFRNVPADQYPFVIDPDLFWSTYLHTISPYIMPLSIIHATDITSDQSGNIFVSAYCAGSIKFPTINPGNGAYYKDVYDSTNGTNLYLKFNEKGVLLWATYFSNGAYVNGLSGSGLEGGLHISVDSKGNLFTASKTQNISSLTLINNGGYFDSGLNNGSTFKCYLAKFDVAGALVWCTTLASYDISLNRLMHDADDNLYICGNTNGLPYLIKDPGNGAYVNKTMVYGSNPFITKFDKNCNLIWSTDIPGGNDAELIRMAVDSKNKSVYIFKTVNRYNTYPYVNAGGYFNTTDFSSSCVITKFDSTYKMVWSTRLPSFRGDVTTDTSGNLYVVGSGFGGNRFPYVDPGNGAYTDPNPSNRFNGGCIFKFDAKTNLVWATTYYGGKNYFFTKVVHEKYRNLIHFYGIMNDIAAGTPTLNDGCNGSYYTQASVVRTATDPIIGTFTTGGKLLYASFNDFIYSYYDYSEMNVDYKGNLLLGLGYVQESTSVPFVPLKNPGNGAFFQDAMQRWASYASIIMKLTPSILDVSTSTVLPLKCDSTGSISITPNCGNGDYSYQWDRGIRQQRLLK